MSSVHIVLDGSRVVGVSARLQGAENIRIDEARRRFAWWREHSTRTEAEVLAAEKIVYDRLRIENHNVQDED